MHHQRLKLFQSKSVLVLQTVVHVSFKKRATGQRNKEDYQFPGVFTKQFQAVFYTPDYTKFVAPRHTDPHFMWSDIQLSKDKVNIHTTTMEIAGNTEVVTYRSAPCNGVKVCPVSGCSHVVPISKKHPKEQLQKTNFKDSKCPIQFTYVHPNKKLWILGLLASRKKQQRICTIIHCILHHISSNSRYKILLPLQNRILI